MIQIVSRKKNLYLPFLLGFAFFLAVHGFCLLNLSYSGSSIILNARKDLLRQIMSGRFLIPYYTQIRGGVASPLLIGLFMFLFLFLTQLLLQNAGDLQNLPGSVLFCLLLHAHPAILEILSSNLHLADAYALAFLLCVGSVLVARLPHRLSFLPGAVLFAMACALSGESWSIACGCLLFLWIADSLQKDFSPLPSLRFLLSFLLGSLLYLLGYIFFLHRQGLDPQASLQYRGSGILELYLYPVRMLFGPVTAYPHASPIASCVLIFCCILAFFRLLRSGRLFHPILAGASFLLMPLAINLPFFSGSSSPQFRFAYLFLPLSMILLIVKSAGLFRKQLLKWCTALSVIILSFGILVFANQVYLKKSLEFDSTLSAMTRVVDRVEETEGYVVNVTPVAVIGSLSASPITGERYGFEHLAVLEAAQHNTAVPEESLNTWYFWEILGYPLNMVDDYNRDLLKQRKDVTDMPAFPADGSIRFIDDVLVIRLSNP